MIIYRTLQGHFLRNALPPALNESINRLPKGVPLRRGASAPLEGRSRKLFDMILKISRLLGECLDCYVTRSSLNRFQVIPLRQFDLYMYRYLCFDLEFFLQISVSVLFNRLKIDLYIYLKRI